MENNMNKQILHFMQMMYDNQNKLSQELEKMSKKIQESNVKIPFEEYNKQNVSIFNKTMKNQVILNDNFSKLNNRIEKPSVNNYQNTHQYILFNKDFLKKYQLRLLMFYFCLMIAPGVYFYIQQQNTANELTECSTAFYKLKKLYDSK